MNPTIIQPLEEEKILDLTFSQVILGKDEGEGKPKKAKICALVAGWNLNDFYIPKSVLPTIKDLVMSRTKIFLDHDPYAYMGRKTSEWAANYESVYLSEDENEIWGDIVFTENPNTSWIYKEAKKKPEDVQFSMHFAAITEEYTDTALNRTGQKVIGIRAYRSTDIVTYGAAGGKAVQVYNSMIEGKLKNIEDLMASQLNNKKENEEMDIKSVQDLKTQYPNLITELLNSERAQLEEGFKTKEVTQKVTELTNSNNALVTEKTNLEAKVTELTNSINTLTIEKVALQSEVDTFKVAEVKAQWDGQVETELTNSEIAKELITEAFKETLLAQTDLVIVQKMISDRKSLSAASVVNPGAPPKSTPEEKKEIIFSEEEIVDGFKKY